MNTLMKTLLKLACISMQISTMLSQLNIVTFLKETYNQANKVLCSSVLRIISFHLKRI